ncbi:MAG: PAS domain-containing protein, partial [Gemmatimonadales bacterium]
MSDVELSDEDLRGFLDLPTELFGVFDPGRGTAWCSPTVAAVLGYRPEELHRVDLAVLVHPDDLGAPTEDIEDFPRDGGPRTLEVRCRRKDGGWRWLELSGMWDEAAQVLYGSARDVTERHEAREAARASERLVEAIL